MTLLQSYFKKGYNVTTDNYFTSLKLAEEFKQRKTTILGTIRKQRREVSNTDLVTKDKSLHTSKIYSSPSGCSLTIYKAKKKKVVCSLSSMHRIVNIHQGHKKKLPETVQYYNKSKLGVDALDQRLDTIPARAPVGGGCVFNILDCACINSFIVYCSTTKVKLSRRQFLLELIKELCKPKDGVGCATHFSAVTQMSRNALPANTAEAHQARKRKECQFVLCENRSSSFCENCQKVCCGKHTSSKVTIMTCKNCAD